MPKLSAFPRFLSRRLGPVMLASTVTLASAQMVALGDDELENTRGQGGADIALNLRWNLQSTTSTDSSTLANYQYNCVSGDDRWCRLGLTANSRYSAAGTKEWLVFKKVQGAIEIPKIGLDAAPVQYTSNGSLVNAMAFQVGFDASQPIRLRNLGFESLSLEADSAADGTAGNTPGYAAATSTYSAGSTYGTGNAVAGSFDAGRETGFVGLKINADVAIGGTVKVFACPATIC